MKEGDSLNTHKYKYISYWTDKDNKVKGSGVGLLIHQDLAIHVSRVVRHSQYMLSIRLSFKKATIVVTQIYVPPNNKEIQREMVKDIKALNDMMSLYKQTNGRQRLYNIIMGDFNSTISPEIDRFPARRNYSDPSEILKTLMRLNMWDAFRLINKTKRDYTWTNHLVKSCINLIWISDNWAQQVIHSKHKSTKFIMTSDYKIVAAMISTKTIIRNGDNMHRCKKINTTRKKYLYGMMEGSNWVQYRVVLEMELKQRDIDNRIKYCSD